MCNITTAAPMPFLLENSEKCVSDMIMFSYHPRQAVEAQLMCCARSSVPKNNLLYIAIGEDILLERKMMT